MDMDENGMSIAANLQFIAINLHSNYYWRKSQCIFLDIEQINVTRVFCNLH